MSEDPPPLKSQLTPRPRAGFGGGARAIMLVLAVAVAAILARVMRGPASPAPVGPTSSVPRVIQVEVVPHPSATASP